MLAPERHRHSLLQRRVGVESELENLDPATLAFGQAVFPASLRASATILLGGGAGGSDMFRKKTTGAISTRLQPRRARGKHRPKKSLGSGEDHQAV